MPVVSKLQSGFTSGELDPKLRGRSDIASYYNGASKLRNVLVIPQGAVKRRPGMEYVDTLATGNIQLIPFIYSAEEHYLIVMTTNLATIYKDGAVVDTVACTLTDDQIPEITWAQSYDTLILFHQDFTPKAFIRASETSWSTQAWVLTNVPTRNFGVSATTTLNIQSNASVNIDFADWTIGNVRTLCKFTTGAATFVSGNVGDYIRAGGGYAKITAVSTATLAIATILSPFINDDQGNATDYAAGEWAIEEPVWSATRGYPACGTFFQGRLYMANTSDLPNTLWGSIVNNENDFQNWLPEYADNGLEISAGGGLMSRFTRLHAGQHLFILADTGEFYVPTQNRAPITPTNASLVRNSSLGSLNLPTFEINGAVVFMRFGGKSLVESQFNFANGSYQNKDLSLLASHLLSSPQSIAYRQQTNTDEADYILVVNDDGTLAVLCTLRVQDVTAWTLCETEGDFIATAVDGSEMYFVVDRTIDGTPVRTLEKFNSDMLLDCAVRNVSPDQTTLTGLDHLDGQEISVVMDNSIQPDATPVAGSITLEREGDDVQAGFPFPIVDEDSESRVYIETMPIETDLSDGTSVGQKKRIVEVTVLIYETSHIIVQKNKTSIRRLGIDHLDAPVPKLTENMQIKGLLGWDDEITVSVGQTLPLPMQLLGLAYKVRV